jgi:hypothetical protein
MTFIAELLHKMAGIEVGPTRAMFMNVTIKSKLWTPLIVEFRESTVGGEQQ